MSRSGMARWMLALSILAVTQTTQAEVQTITSTVRQSFGGSQSPDDALTAALARAKREALEQAGSYIESLTIVSHHAVEKDEILALAAGVLNAEIVSQQNYATEDAFGMEVTAEVRVDTGVLEMRIRKLLNDRSTLARYREGLGREKALLDQIRVLEARNRELQRSATTAQRAQLKAEFGKATRRLAAVELNTSVLSHYGHQSFEDVDATITILKEAIALDPSYGAAHNSLGIALYQKGELDQAVQSFRESERLLSKESAGMSPSLPSVWTSLGAAYSEKGEYDSAVDYFHKVLALGPSALSPETAVALYINLGNTYYLKGVRDSCLTYHQKALSEGMERLGASHKLVGAAYHYVGTAYLDTRDYPNAVASLNRALTIGLETLGPGHVDLAKVYASLGKAYAATGETRQAVGCLEQSVAIAEEHFGDGHRMTASYRNLLVSVRSGAPVGAPAKRLMRAPPGSWREAFVWRKLRRGMSMDEVLSILGKPGKVVGVPEGTSKWYYGRAPGAGPKNMDVGGAVHFENGRAHSWEEP